MRDKGSDEKREMGGKKGINWDRKSVSGDCLYILDILREGDALEMMESTKVHFGGFVDGCAIGLKT